MALMSKQLLRNLLQLLLITAFIVAPNLLLYSLNRSSEELPKRALFSLLVFAGLLVFLFLQRGKRIKLELNLIDWSVLSFGLAYLLSSLFSIDPLNSLFGVYGGPSGNNNTAAFILVSIIFYFLVKYAYKTKILSVETIILSIAAGGAVGWLVYFHLVGALTVLSKKPFLVLFENPPKALPSTQTHQIVYSFYLLAVFWATFLYGLVGLKSLQGKLLVLLSALFFWQVLLTQVRGAILVHAAAVVLLTAIYALPTLRNASAKGKLLLLGLAILGILALFVRKDLVVSRFAGLTKDTPPHLSTTAIRLAEWKGAVAVFLERPVFGYGPNTIRYTYPRYKPEFINKNELEWPIDRFDIRNHYLNIAATTGIFGLGSFLLIIAFSFAAIYKTRASPQTVPAAGIFITAVLASALYHQGVALAILFWASIGLISAQSKMRPFYSLSFSAKTDKKLKLGAVILAISGLAAVSLNTASNFYLVKADQSADRCLLTLKTEHLRQSNELFLLSQTLNPFNVKAYLGQGGMSTGLVRGLTTTQDSELDTGKVYQDGREALEKALSLTPLNPDAKRDLALLNFYHVQINPEEKPLLAESINLARQLVIAEPTHPRLWDTLGQVLLHDQQLDEAEKAFGKAISLKDNVLSFKYHLAETWKQQGKLKQSLELYQSLYNLDKTSLAQENVEQVKKLIEEREK